VLGLEARERGGGGTEGIEVGLMVSLGAIGVDQAQHLCLLGGIEDSHARLGGSLADGRRVYGQLSARAEGEALEESAPRRVHRIRVLEPGLVGRLDEGCIRVGGEREGSHGEEIVSPSSVRRTSRRGLGEMGLIPENQSKTAGISSRPKGMLIAQSTDARLLETVVGCGAFRVVSISYLPRRVEVREWVGSGSVPLGVADRSPERRS